MDNYMDSIIIRLLVIMDKYMDPIIIKLLVIIKISLA